MKWLDWLLGRGRVDADAEQRQRHYETMDRVARVIDEGERRRERMRLEVEAHRRQR